MLERILRLSIRYRWSMMVFTAVIAILGVIFFSRLTIDAVPDVTNIQVQVNTEASGFTPVEAEQRITVPLEASLAGIPHLKETRSVSRYGLSQITVIFEDGTDIYFARQQVNERIQQAKSKLPAGIEPGMGPIATGLGEIFLWTVNAKEGAKKPDGTPYTPVDFRTIQDWIIKPQLRGIPGVNEVNSIGGFERQFHVAPIPERLVAYDFSMDDIANALLANNANVGASYIEHLGEQYLIRVPGQISTLDDIRNVAVGVRGGQPVRVSDIAEVLEGKELRTGAATQDGKEVVLGTVFMLMGENSRNVSSRVAEKMEEINRTLPEGVQAQTVYDRTHLVELAIKTVRNNLIEGAILVIVVLFLFLGNVRAAIITALVIPLSMLFTIMGMAQNDISANLMSLGALDFGLIVDGAVIIVENCMRLLAEEQHRLGRNLTLTERLEKVFRGSQEVRRATIFGELIIMVVYIPILTLTGVEGKMFKPMAFTVIMALLGAMLFSVTFVPAAIAIFMRGRINEKEGRLVTLLKKLYLPTLRATLQNKGIVIGGSLFLMLLTGLMLSRMGSEFIPSLDEGDMAIHALRIPGTSLSQAVAMQHEVEKTLKKFGEVETVYSKLGTADIATDPMPPSVADTFVSMKPREQWPEPNRSKEDLVLAMEKALKELPGNNYEFTQPIQMRFNELLAGVRADVAVKIFGDDMEVLEQVGKQISKIVEVIPGASDVKLEQVTGLPVLSLNLNRDVIARYGLSINDVQAAVQTAVGGKLAGQVFEGDRRFPILVRLSDATRSDFEALKQLPIAIGNSTAKDGKRAYVPLGVLAEFEVAPGPNQVSRENGKRRVVVTANVRGRDLGSFVSEAQNAVLQQVAVPTGYWIAWGGQFEHLVQAARRLTIVIPLALFLVALLLFISLKNSRDALLVLTGVPMALTGGVLALWLRGMPLSISAGVGFIALSGVAVLNGLVMVSFIQRLRAEGQGLNESIEQGAITRLRPVLMTALVASLGFIPMALASGTGAEVQRPLATVVIGGILSSTLLTLLVLPALYEMMHRREKNDAAMLPVED